MAEGLNDEEEFLKGKNNTLVASCVGSYKSTPLSLREEETGCDGWETAGGMVL